MVNNNLYPDTHTCTKLFKYGGSRKTNILLCQLRNYVSDLNYDLYNSHLIDNPACHCGHTTEDREHYFLYCQQYTIYRQELITNIQSSNNTIPIDINTFLYGCTKLSDHCNSCILQEVQRFNSASKRFSYISH